MKPVFLIQGIDYRQNSAGIRCLHTLCEKLLDRNEDAWLSRCLLAENSSARIATSEDIESFQDRDVVIILPEILGGRYPWAALTVRWLLNSPGKVGEDKSGEWQDSDLLCHFEPAFRMKDSIPLAVPHVDRKVFNNLDNPFDNKRVSGCFYAKKTRCAGFDAPCPKGLVDITDMDLMPQDLAFIYRQSRFFYTTEPTACSIEAELCGARNVYLPSDYMKKPPEVTDFVSWYGDLERRSDRELDSFVDVCYDRLGSRRCLEVA